MEKGRKQAAVQSFHKAVIDMALRMRTVLPHNILSLAMVWLVIVAGTGATQTAAPQMAVAHGAAQERLQPSLDLAQFQDAKRVSYLDISYAVPMPVLRSESTAVPQSEAFELILDLRVYKNDSFWATKVWKL